MSRFDSPERRCADAGKARLARAVAEGAGSGAPTRTTSRSSRAIYGQTDVLLPADAESNVTARPRLPVEVLKVAHHGSEDDGPGDQPHLRPGDRGDLGRPMQRLRHPRAGTV